MPPKSASPKSRGTPARKAGSVEDLMASLDHQLKAAVEALRATIRAVSPRIDEEVKWNSPSFYTSDHFATINIGRKTKARPDDHIMVILHRGAKAMPATTPELAIKDPTSLLEPLGRDRYAISFRSLNEVRAKSPHLQAIIRQWIKHL